MFLQSISSIFLLIVNLGIDSIMAKLHIKVDFNEFVQNSLYCDMGIIVLTSMFMEAVGGQKHYSERTLWHSTQRSVHPTVPFLLTKRNKK